MMKVLKKINRKVVSPMIMNLKGDKIIRNLTRNSILNIMYHGVVSRDSNYFSPRHISSEQFEKQLKYFAKEFDVISLAQAFEYMKEGYKPGRKTITISFDDGYMNNLYTALPLLEKYRMKATFFISGICAEDMEMRVLWPDIISCLAYFHRDSVIDLGNKRFVNFKDVESNISLRDFLNSCSEPVLNKHLVFLYSAYDLKEKMETIPDELWKVLTRDEIKALSCSELADIGSHGYSHLNLSGIEITEAQSELRKSKEELQRITGKSIRSIAYPFGSYSETLKNLAEQAGYDYQLAVDYNDHSDLNDKRVLNRHGIASTTTFEANILLLNYAFITKGFN